MGRRHQRVWMDGCVSKSARGVETLWPVVACLGPQRQALLCRIASIRAWILQVLEANLIGQERPQTRALKPQTLSRVEARHAWTQRRYFFTGWNKQKMRRTAQGSAHDLQIWANAPTRLSPRTGEATRREARGARGRSRRERLLCASATAAAPSTSAFDNGSSDRRLTRNPTLRST